MGKLQNCALPAYQQLTNINFFKLLRKANSPNVGKFFGLTGTLSGNKIYI
jgi:hypothetical protein